MFTPLEVSVFAMTACWFLLSSLTNFWRHANILGIFYIWNSTSINVQHRFMGHSGDDAIHERPFENKKCIFIIIIILLYYVRCKKKKIVVMFAQCPFN